MSFERKLHDAMVLDGQWRDATQEMLENEWTVDAQAERFGTVLRDHVIRGHLQVRDLRAGVAWVNALDGEATIIARGDISSLGEADFLEATARRIVHGAGKQALKVVKTTSRLEIARVNYANLVRMHERQSNKGLYMLEDIDLDLNLL